ncbi:MAG: universal stress protein [Flavobacteriales bacterium]
MSIRTIIVPYDFSECATDALRVAGDLAHRTGAVIDVVHAYEETTHSHVENHHIREEIEGRLARIPELPFLQGVELRKFMLRQLTVTEIFKNERLSHADLIVMGTHGASGMKGIVGSNTQRIVRQAPMPVLVIKHHIEQFELNNVVFASNFSQQDVEKFEAFRPLLDLFDAKVHLLKVNTPRTFERSEDSHRAIAGFLQRHELRRYTVTVYNDLSIEEGILNFAQSIDADLIAMATHGRTGFFHVVNGSITEDIVNHTPLPVLSVKL